MTNTSNNLPMSASQEISLLKGAHKLNKLIESLGFKLPLRLLAYDCKQDLSPVGMALLGYEVHVVNSDPTTRQRFEQYTDTFDKFLTYDSYPLFELGEKAKQAFDVILINGVVLTELMTDAQLLDACQQLAATLKPDGLLLISSADFDDTLRVKERVLRPRVMDDSSGRHIQVVVRDWHGNGNAYTETHYLIEDGNGQQTVTYHKQQRRAWRHAEIVLTFAQAGLTDVQWQSDAQSQQMMIARKISQISSN